jgi:hypothetical protein
MEDDKVRLSLLGAIRYDEIFTINGISKNMSFSI